MPLDLDSSDINKLQFRNVLGDGLVVVHRPMQPENVISTPESPIVSSTDAEGYPIFVSGGRSVGGYDRYALTEAGRELYRRWFSAELISPEPTE